MPLGRLASGSWSQLSTPTLDKTRPLLAGTMESISTRGQRSTPCGNERTGLIWSTTLNFWHLLFVVSVVGIALEGVDVQVLVIVLFLLGLRLRLGGAAEQLESLKRNDAEQGNDNGDKGNLDCLRKFRETQLLFLGVIIGEALFARAFGICRRGRGLRAIFRCRRGSVLIVEIIARCGAIILGLDATGASIAIGIIGICRTALIVRGARVGGKKRVNWNIERGMPVEVSSRSAVAQES